MSLNQEIPQTYKSSLIQKVRRRREWPLHAVASRSVCESLVSLPVTVKCYHYPQIKKMYKSQGWCLLNSSTARSSRVICHHFYNYVWYPDGTRPQHFSFCVRRRTLTTPSTLIFNMLVFKLH